MMVWVPGMSNLADPGSNMASSLIRTNVFFVKDGKDPFWVHQVWVTIVQHAAGLKKGRILIMCIRYIDRCTRVGMTSNSYDRKWRSTLIWIPIERLNIPTFRMVLLPSNEQHGVNVYGGLLQWCFSLNTFSRTYSAPHLIGISEMNHYFDTFRTCAAVPCRSTSCGEEPMPESRWGPRFVDAFNG